MVTREFLNYQLTVKEALGFLNDHHITSSEQMLRRLLRNGRIKGIPPKNRKSGWRITTGELICYMNSLKWEGTAYEEGIDDKTKIKRLFEEIDELKMRIKELENEKEQLEARLGIPPF